MDALLEQVRARALGPEAPNASGVRLSQRGEIRLGPDKPWVPFEAEQIIRASTPQFRWTARVRMAPLFTVRVVDAYEAGRGLLDVRLWGWVPLARESGPEIDAGELIRYLAELPWCPFAYAGNPHLTTRSEDATHLRITAGEGAVRFTVNAQGDVTEAFAESRPRRVGTSSVATAWTGTFSAHVEMGGIRIPGQGVVAWLLEDGPFEYYRGTITELRLTP